MFFKRYCFNPSIYKSFIRTRPRLRGMLVACLGLSFGLAEIAYAEICIFSQMPEACSDIDCIADFQQSSDSGVGAHASINLGERRVQVRASGGVGFREANGIVGIGVGVERTMDVDFTTVASFSGVLQGSILPGRFGRVRADLDQAHHPESRFGQGVDQHHRRRGLR